MGMFDEYMGKMVKVVMRDGRNIKSLRGKFLDEDENFIKIELERTGKPLTMNKEKIDKVRLDEPGAEKGGENGTNHHY